MVHGIIGTSEANSAGGAGTVSDGMDSAGLQKYSGKASGECLTSHRVFFQVKNRTVDT